MQDTLPTIDKRKDGAAREAGLLGDCWIESEDHAGDGDFDIPENHSVSVALQVPPFSSGFATFAVWDGKREGAEGPGVDFGINAVDPARTGMSQNGFGLQYSRNF